jgi:hypothetical protein
MGWGQWGEMSQALYAYMNNKRKKRDEQFTKFLELCFLIYNMEILASSL